MGEKELQCDALLLNKQYLFSASQGNLEEFLQALRSVSDVDITNKRGWTALMFAARNGHSVIVRELLKRGCNTLKMNSNGQTALDIAEFWLHAEPVKLLSSYSSRVTVGRTNHFCDNPLDRVSYRRTDKIWIERALQHPKSVFIAFSNLCPLVYLEKNEISPSENVSIDKTKTFGSYRLARFDCNQISKFAASEEFILLGVETMETANCDSSEVSSGWFAIKTDLDFPDLESDRSGVLKMPFPDGFWQLKRGEAAIVSQGRSLLSWHDRNKFCSTCGSPSKFSEAGYKRQCSNELCKTQKGVHNTCHPRVDPSVIMAISSPDNKKLLLAKNKSRHFANMRSILAGFVEPGESIEEACRREVYEETKIQVGSVTYHSSQPWPLPSTLMIGCSAKAVNDSIDIDNEELAEARWFTVSEIQMMLKNEHPENLVLPPPETVAHQLILQWLHQCR